MPSTSTFRIPKAPITGACGWFMTQYAKRRLGGEFPDNGYVYFHQKAVLKDVLGFEAKVSEVPRWRESEEFSPLERDVLEYAEAMTVTPPTVTDEMVAHLVDALGAPAMVELTQMVALENMRSRFNSAAGLQSQGYSDVCELPLARPAAVPSPT